MGDAVDNNAGAATQFLQLAIESGGYWKSWVNQIEDTGFDLRGFVYADNGTGTSNRSLANISQLLSNSPTDGDEVMVEFKVKFDIDKATAGNTVFWLSAYRSDNAATATTTEAAPGYADTAKAGICARALSTNFEGYVITHTNRQERSTFVKRSSTERRSTPQTCRNRHGIAVPPDGDLQQRQGVRFKYS
jgi:hypothetical protein